MSFEIWSWLARIPDALLFAAALIVLLRKRRYCRRPSNLALMAIVGLAANWVFWIGAAVTRGLWGGNLDSESKLHVFLGVSLLGHFWSAACVFALVCAVVMDRRTSRLSDAEADYGDTIGSHKS
jgi:hypothetical protein